MKEINPATKLRISKHKLGILKTIPNHHLDAEADRHQINHQSAKLNPHLVRTLIL